MRLPKLTSLVVLAAASAFAGAASLERADALFESGNFADAEKAYASALAENPRSTEAELRLGSIALFSNRLNEAESHLRKAAAVPGANQRLAERMLAETLCRRDQLAVAAGWLRATGQDARARALDLFGGAQPYRIEGIKASTHVKLVSTDPLPVVQVRVNGGEPVRFGVDTGTAESLLDSSFAKRLGIEWVGDTGGAPADESRASTGYGRITSLRIGDFRVNDIPVRIVALPNLGKTEPRGVLGTALLSHFLATLSYPEKELVLRRRSPDELRRFEQLATTEKQASLPFWLAGDRVVVRSASDDHAEPRLFQLATAAAAELPTSTENSYGVRVAGLVSNDVFRSNAVTLDFASMRIFLNPFIVGYPMFSDRTGTRRPQPLRGY